MAEQKCPMNADVKGNDTFLGVTTQLNLDWFKIASFTLLEIYKRKLYLQYIYSSTLLK